jgi:putative ABC transport system permease protein
MIRSYVLTAWRSLLRSKFFTVLNITGLALGLTAALLIFQYVAFQLSFDEQHDKGDRIYRVTYSKEKDKEIAFNTVLVYAGVGNLMKQAFPEVEDYCRVRPLQMANPKGPVRVKDVAFEEDGVYWADPNFFTFFSYPLLIGDPATVLKDQFTAVVSESIAKKYFGNEPPVGQTLKVGQKAEVTVTGVFKDIPANTHMKFGVLVSHTTLKPLLPAWWNDDNLQLFHGPLFLLLKPGTNPKTLADKFPKFVDDHINGVELRKTGVELKFAMMPLHDIHLNSHIQHEAEVNGDIKIVKYMGLIGAIILFIAWINYINLATSRALERAKEVGIRKVIGAAREHLVVQFLFESLLVNTLAATIAILLLAMVQPVLSQIGAGDAREFNWLANTNYIVICVVVFAAGILISGFYPAVVLSGFKPITVLKGKFTNSRYGIVLRKSLVVAQFVASVSLIIGTATIYRQIQFLRDKDLGFDIRQTVVVKAPLVVDSTFQVKTLSFKKELQMVPSVAGVAASYSVPGMEPGGASWYTRVGDNPDNHQFCTGTWVDENYIPDFQMKLLAGRNFAVEDRLDAKVIILNEACLPLFGFKEPKDAIGAKINEGADQVYDVIGVVQNFQQKSLKTDFSPIIIFYQPQTRGFYSAKVETTDGKSLQATLSTMEQVWKRFFPENPFIYYFLDDEFSKQFKSDQQFGKLFTFFSIIAIFIGCLGLLGLSSYMVAKRTKEIGIRKVLGSDVHQLVGLLTREFVVLITVANLIAWPIVMYLMDEWLNTFAHRITIGVGIFAMSAGLIFVIAMGTISFQVLRASRANPVTALRSE